MPQISRARRCKSLYESEQVDSIRSFAKEVQAAFDLIRLEYAKHSVE
jgi:hypothetical protein